MTSNVLDLLESLRVFSVLKRRRWGHRMMKRFVYVPPTSRASLVAQW